MSTKVLHSLVRVWPTNLFNIFIDLTDNVQYSHERGTFTIQGPWPIRKQAGPREQSSSPGYHYDGYKKHAY